MITRVVERKRPRRSAFAVVVVGALLAASVLATGVLAALVSDTGSYDLTVANKNTSTGLVDIGNASVEYIGSSANNESSGTGIFDPFVRLQGSPTEKGYNTDGTVQFETKVGQWTHAIKASAIPVVDCDGDGIGTATCWELFVDINDSNNAKRISLNEMEIWFTDSATLVGYVDPDGFAAGTATQVYDFTGDLLFNDVNQGSGRGDVRYLVPLANIDAWTSDTYFVLYSKWGVTSGTPGTFGTGTYVSDGGFEEWKVRKAPNVSIVKTADALSVNAGQSIGFTVTLTNTGVADATGVTVNDPLPGGTGVDWSIDSQSPAGSCSISGAPPTETLICGPLTLASDGGQLTVHVTSNTTTASCGNYDNTASFTSTNAGSGSDDASVVVLCGALQITKTAKHADTSGGTSANLVATFTIVDAGGNSRTLTTNAAGVGCIGGVTIGTTQSITETSVPTGYAAPTIANVNVASGSCSGTTLTGGTSVGVENTPLTTISWGVNSLRDGATSTVVTCRDGAGTILAGYPVTVSDGTGSLPNLTPTDPSVTVSCDFVVDP